MPNVAADGLRRLIIRDTPCTTVAFAQNVAGRRTQTPCHGGDVSCRAGFCHRPMWLCVYATTVLAPTTSCAPDSLFRRSAPASRTTTLSLTSSIASSYLVGHSRKDTLWRETLPTSGRVNGQWGCSVLAFRQILVMDIMLTTCK